MTSIEDNELQQSFVKILKELYKISHITKKENDVELIKALKLIHKGIIHFSLGMMAKEEKNEGENK